MRQKNANIFFEKVMGTEEQIEILYIHLKNRKYSISHKLLPQYQDHIKFVKNHPYRDWFIIKEAKEIIGNVYVHFDNSIGLNCTDEITEVQIGTVLQILTNTLKPLEPVPSVRSSGYFINVPTANTQLQEKLLHIGLVELQKSFQLIRD